MNYDRERHYSEQDFLEAMIKMCNPSLSVRFKIIDLKNQQDTKGESAIQQETKGKQNDR